MLLASPLSLASVRAIPIFTRHSARHCSDVCPLHATCLLWSLLVPCPPPQIRSATSNPPASPPHTCPSTPAAFSVLGGEDSIISSSIGKPTHHRLAFCAAGQTAAGVLDGCVTSCKYSVSSRARQIDWGTHPTVIRSYRTPRHSLVPGETTLALILPGAEAVDVPTDALPPTPVARVRDASGQPVPQKALQPFVVITRVVKEVCDAMGTPVTDEEALRPLDFECGLAAVYQIQSSLVKLKVREGKDVAHFSGVDGFLSMPLVYTLLSSAWLSGEGKVRACVRAACVRAASIIQPLFLHLSLVT